MPQRLQVVATASFWCLHAGQRPAANAGRISPLHFPQLMQAYPHDIAHLNPRGSRIAPGNKPSCFPFNNSYAPSVKST